MLLRVREFRRKAGLKQTDLAARLCLSREMISAIETQRHCPNIDLLEKIATALGCQVAHLLAEQPSAETTT